jgi:membrane associated rhomboid family serine protease
MGLENRDYFRDGSYTSSLAGWGMEPLTPVVKYLIIVNVAVLLLQIFLTHPADPLPSDEPAVEREYAPEEPAASRPRNEKVGEEVNREEQGEARRRAQRESERLQREGLSYRVSVVQEWLELAPEKTFRQGQLWRLLTCAFCHTRESFWHIAVNMVMLYWFGIRLETMYGSREFLLFYLAAAVCSSLAYLGVAACTRSAIPAIGASGAVMGVMMLYTIYYPFETFFLFWCVPLPLWALLSLYVLFDLHPVLLALAGDQVFSSVAHAGHLGGLAFGYLYWRLGLCLEAPFDRVGRSVRRPGRKSPRVAEAEATRPRRDSPDDRVDEVLRKISDQGRESLTAEEMAILTRASEKYRGRS